MMKRTVSQRKLRRREQGQSFPLIALAIVVIVAMVALSVDVGNSFAEERRVVAASNAASVTAMDTFLRNRGAVTNQTIYETAARSLSGNGVFANVENGGSTIEALYESRPNSDTQLQLEVFYYDADGDLIGGGPVEPNGNLVPNNVSTIQVEVNGTIDTFFARVVGQNTLPVRADSYAGTCPSGYGVYPVMVPAGSINDVASRFHDTTTLPPPSISGNRSFEQEVGEPVYGPYEANGQLYSYRWLNLSDDNQPGSFGFSKWESEGNNSVQVLAASLTLPGNADQNFVENDWMNVSGLTKPDDYPSYPGVPSAGDWISATPGNNINAGDVNEQFNFHKDNQTDLILPIYDYTAGTGQNAAYHVAYFGVFRILDWKNTTGRGVAIKFAYLGRSLDVGTACSVGVVSPPENRISLRGNVEILPAYQERPSDDRPLQVVVVLDTSGSMSANFAGQCNAGESAGGVDQCARGLNSTTGQVIDAAVGGTGKDRYWATEDERRIYIAKNAVFRLADLLNLEGSAGFDPNRPFDQISLVSYNSSARAATNFTNKYTTIYNSVRDANKQGSDFYLTNGGTNGGAGLYSAAVALERAPKTINFTPPGGSQTSYEYKRVVLFITDGVTNRYFDPTATGYSGGGVSNSHFENGHPCRSVSQLAENAPCQTTDYGGVPVSVSYTDRPITQMGNVSINNIKNNSNVNAQVFALALSAIPDNGLKDRVASGPSYYTQVPALVRYNDGRTNVDIVMEQIYQRAATGDCVPRTASEIGFIPQEYSYNVGGIAYPSVGEVLLTNPQGITLRAPIVAEATSTGSVLTYRFGPEYSLSPGTYSLAAYTYYRSPVDGQVRRYDQFLASESLIGAVSFSIDSRQADTLQGEVRFDLTDTPAPNFTSRALRLANDVCGGQ